jgi:amino acid adenylation domain-containing protein
MSNTVQSNLSAAEKRALLAQLLSKKVSEAETYPLSHGQQALWFLYNLDPQSWAYNILFSARIRSAVDVSALERSFQRLLDRHASLRATFSEQNGQPIQQIQRQQKVDFQQIDAADWPADQLMSRVTEYAQRPFDLTRGPMLRVYLFTRANDDHILLFVIHHIVIDLWALLILLDELRVIYPAEQAGLSAELPPLKSEYRDYVRWQREMIAGNAGERAWQYWQQNLNGNLPVLNLPTDRPRPVVQTYSGSSYSFEIDAETTARLKTVAKTTRATLHAILLTTFQVLLYRYTNQEDILIGSPSVNRTAAELKEIVGYFTNPVVTRGDLSSNPNFSALLQQLRKTIIAGLDHQDYPLPLLIEKLQLPRDASRLPLFQAAFVLQKMHKLEELGIFFVPGQSDTRVDFGGLTLEHFGLPQQEGQFELKLEIMDMVETRGILYAFLKYNSDLFEPTTIARMAGHFQTLLKAITENPDQPIATLPLLTAAERQTLLVDWNNTRADYREDLCIHEMFQEQVKRRPNAVAVVFEEKQLSYRQLNAAANQVARHLKSLGVKPETLVGICVERSLEMVIAILGILKAGAAYLPLDSSYPVERLAFMVQDAQISLLLTHQHLLPRLPELTVPMVLLDRDWPQINQYSTRNPVTKMTPNNLAYVIYTSGSTGLPKGVLLEHGGMANLTAAHISNFAVKPQDRVLQFSSFSFDASVWDMMMALQLGATLVMARQDAVMPGPDLLELLKSQRVTIATLPPSVLALLPVEELPDLRTIIVAGDACAAEVVARWGKGREFFNAYGPTEATIWATIYQCSDTSRRPLIGRPVNNKEIYLLDTNLQPVPIGLPGEIHIGGVGLARGYHRRPELTGEKFITHPFSDRVGARLYKTGDLGCYRSDGNIDFLGRLDHQVKVRGFRIELGEIEEVLNQYLDIEENVVIAREDQPGEKRLVAYLVAASGQSLAIAEVRNYLKQKLPEYMVPSVFVVLPALPLSPNGKIDRRALPRPEQARKSLTQKYLEPRDNVELQLQQIWQEILKTEPVGVKDNFFELGGHSLLAVQLMARIEKGFGRNYPLATLFQHSTIEQLAGVIRQQQQPVLGELVPIQTPANTTKPPIFCMHAAGGNVLSYAELANLLGKDQPFYGLQARGLDGSQPPFNELTAMAANYLQQIRGVQPQGPYHLAGWCLGGIIAFEIAQQLRQQGEEVALLALFDSKLPAGQPMMDDTSVLLFFADSLTLGFVRDAAAIGEFVQLSFAEQINYLFTEAKNANIFPPDMELAQLHILVDIVKANMQAAWNYQPQPQSTRAIYLRATEEPAEIIEPWRGLFTGRFDTDVVPGNHMSLLRKPNVSVVAEKLLACLYGAEVS